MMRLFCVLMLVSFSVFAQDFAPMQDWSTIDKALLAASTALLVVDWGQTRYISKNPDKFHELNPILGKHPSLSKVNAYFAVCVVGNYLVPEYLLSDYRTEWLVGMTLLETVVVIRNKKIGIKISF